MLCVTSPFERELSATQFRQLWRSLLDGGTSHSRRAETLAPLIRRCEREKIAYTLQAAPGMGYFLTLSKLDNAEGSKTDHPS